MYRDEVQEKAGNALLNQKRDVLLLNGSTGLGKTFLAYLTAKQIIDAGGTAIIALPYHALINQSIGKTEDFTRAGLTQSDIAHFKSSSTWASPTRALNHGITVEAGETVEEVLERCQEEYPLLKASDICVRAQFCPSTEMRYYREYRNNLKQSKILFCTHTALLLNAWTNNRYLNLPSLSRIIVDEADVIVDMAKLLFNRTITNEDFDFLKIKDRQLNEDTIALAIKRSEKMVEADEETALELLAVFRIIEKNWENPYCNIKEVNGEWRVRFRKPATILKRLNNQEEDYQPTKISYMSGTLAMRENEFNRFANSINAKEYETCFAVHSRPRSFGKLKFILAARLTDDEIHELRNHREEWKWTTDIDLTVAAAQKGLVEGHTLILVPSSADTQAIAARLPGAIYQRAGENAKHCVARFAKAVKNGNNHILVGHGIWAGMDIDGGRFKHLIIPRIPYAPVDEVDLDEDFLSNQDRARRKLSQGLGRGLRSKDDECTIWILDKRFPLSSSKMAKIGEDNRFVDSHIALKTVIQSRFELDYQRAKIAYLNNDQLVIE